MEGKSQQRSPAARINYSAAARAKFTAKKYDEAIALYRKHLQSSPRDYNAWNQMGASYYQTGLPRRGLKYLKFVERKTVEKSYNYYYQGLCYTAIGRDSKAKEYFAYAATRFTDEYGSRSTFEMGTIEYKQKNRDRARYWLTTYMQRYPTGVYRGQAQKLLISLQQRRWLKDIDGIEKPDMEKALFKYNKLSLTEHPHYWFFQGGSEMIDRTGKEPTNKGDIRESTVQNIAGVVNAGIGAGPVKQGDMAVFGGYTYRQNWLTDADRIETYTSDPADIQYFPFRGDLLERRHQFYGDFRKQINPLFYWGVYGKMEFARIGSEIYPGPDDENPELKKVLKISDTTTIIPWVGMSMIPNQRTLAYLFLRKEINEDSPEHSNKSYEFGLKGDDPVFSLGVSHAMDFPKHKVESNVELFYYEFIFNDYWLDYTRTGLIVSAEHELMPRWYVGGLFGYYQDEYLLPRLKLGKCSATPDVKVGETIAQTQTPVRCERSDSGYMVQGNVYWNWTQFTRLSGSFQIITNNNDELKEFETQKNIYQFQYTMAFPSVKRVSRFVDRFADNAFTKEAE